MTVQIALLRAINVGGRKQVAMADLRDFLTQLGFGDARSLLQSGNLVFRGDTRSGAALERVLETEAAKRLGLETSSSGAPRSGRRSWRATRSPRRPSAIPAISW